MRPMILAAALSAAALSLAATPTLGAPAPMTRDAAQIASGAYKLDAGHQSIIARLGHQGGVSLSTFRFDKAEGTLQWNAAAPEQSKVDITVDMKSINSPVAGFAAELIGENFLNTGAHPTARFVSTAIRKTGANTGVITGDLTFRGQTKPITVNAELLMGGRNFRGIPVVGFTGNAKFKRSDFGYTAGLPGIGDEIELILDLEFQGPAPAPAAGAPAAR